MTTDTQAAIERLRGLVEPDYFDSYSVLARVGDIRAALGGQS